jgi:hypothetical protein
MSDYDVASQMGLPVPDTIEEAVRQRDGWINAAAMHHRNEEYYCGLLDQIGAALGPKPTRRMTAACRTRFCDRRCRSWYWRV